MLQKNRLYSTIHTYHVLQIKLLYSPRYTYTKTPLNPGGLDLVKSSALDSNYFRAGAAGCVFPSLLFSAHLINCVQLIN
jgi:hypothetical protein